MHKKGRGRSEQALLPPALEDYVKLNNPVRVIDAFVDGLNLAELGFKHSIPREKGRPPYDPADLLKATDLAHAGRLVAARRDAECAAARTLQERGPRRRDAQTSPHRRRL